MQGFDRTKTRAHRQEEARLGFPLLRQCPSTGAIGLVAFLDLLSASDRTACFMLDESAGAAGHKVGVLAEFRPTEDLFTNPRDPRTEAYITGRIG